MTKPKPRGRPPAGKYKGPRTPKPHPGKDGMRRRIRRINTKIERLNSRIFAAKKAKDLYALSRLKEERANAFTQRRMIMDQLHNP